MNVTLPPITKAMLLVLSNKILGSHTKIDPGSSLNNLVFLKPKALSLSKKVISIVIIYKSHRHNLKSSKSVIMHSKKCINSPLKVHNNKKIKLKKIKHSHNTNDKEFSSISNKNKNKSKGKEKEKEKDFLTIVTHPKRLTLS